MTALDIRAIGLGAAAALAIGVPSGLVAQALDGTGTIRDNTSWLMAFTGLILVGLGIGGYVAGRRRLDAPLLHGGAAAVAAYAVVQLIGILGRVVDGESVEWLAIPVLGLLAAASGVAGALVADRQARTPSR